jgi:aminoglycoside/choline kinase family phosphotransferase
MTQINALPDRLAALFVQLTGKKPVTITALSEGGSARKYFRLSNGKISLIGVYNQVQEENRAFKVFSDVFQECSLPVPKVLVQDDSNELYLQTDLGDLHLFDLVQRAHQQGGFHESLTGFYEEALDYLIHFQLDAHPLIPYNIAFPIERFTRKAIHDDLLYFKYYFLKLHPEIQFNESKLDYDLSRFSTHCAAAPGDFFMYRDFQSRNIMIHEGKTWFIDFQGGRKGPLQYDPVSLLYQVKARIPEEVRQQLLSYYLKKLSQRIDIDDVQFLHFLPSFILLRLMQVLGAYGYRGIIQKKAHFLQSIPFAIEEITRFTKNNPLPQGFYHLMQVIEQLEKLQARYPIQDHQPTNKLRVQIGSFSYKISGIPIDSSGNNGGFVFDCRALPNPGRLENFKKLTGKDKEVIDFLKDKEAVKDFLNQTRKIIAASIDNYRERGFKNLMISFGCTGGQHRSVFCAEKIYQWISEQYDDVITEMHHYESNNW